MRATALVLLLAACGPATTHAARPSAASPLLDHEAPRFERRALGGAVVDTNERSGRVTVVDFFAESCVPCARSLPALAAIARERKDVAFVGISEDDDVDGARRMAQKHGLPFPVVHDEGRVLAGRFRVTTLPATFVVDGAGVVRWLTTEAAGEDDLRAAIDAAKAGTGSATENGR